MGLRISLYQYDTVWMDVDANLIKIEGVCGALSGNSDILVLPEMFNTGYTMTPDQIPKDTDIHTIKALQILAQKYQITICGTIPRQVNSQYFNTFITVKPEGLVHSYDKVHLFTPAGEKDVYQAGNTATTLVFNGLEILPLVCYDLRFPYLGYQIDKDVILYSANWPIARIAHWKTLLKARAIENQCYVIGVNRTGNDQNGYEYPGCSMAIHPDGSVLKLLGHQEEWATVAIDKEILETYRAKLPFLQDRLPATK